MDFNTFLAGFMSSLVAGIIFAPLFWVIVRNSPRQVLHFCMRQVRALSLRVRFRWLVITRKRPLSDFRTWSLLEHYRTYVLRIVSDGPAAKQGLGSPPANNCQRYAHTHDPI